MIGDLLTGAANFLDLPGSSVRDALAWKNPFDQYLTPFSDKNRTTGRGLLRHYNLAGDEDTWGNWAAGTAAEMLLDPTNLIGGQAIGKGLKAMSAAKAVNRGVDVANAASMAKRAQGFMPEELVAGLHPAVKNAAGTGPKTMYHGTPVVYDRFDYHKTSPNSLFGRGYYTSDSTGPTGGAGGYWKKGVEDRELEAAGWDGLRYKDPAANFYNQAVAGIFKKYFSHENSPLPRGGVDRLNKIVSKADERLLNRVRGLAAEAGVAPNVRMQYLDIRNPFNGELEQVGDEALMKIGEAAYDKLNSVDPSHPGFSDTFDELIDLMAHPDAGNQPAHEFWGGLKDAMDHVDLDPNEVLKAAGYDGIIHEGGSRMGNGLPHQVAIAFDPQQIYKPYIAPALQNHVNVPKPPSRQALALLANNALTRHRSQ